MQSKKEDKEELKEIVRELEKEIKEAEIKIDMFRKISEACEKLIEIEKKLCHTK